MIEHSAKVPIQYRENKAAFMNFDLYVDERAFIPRPETELLVEVVLEGISRAGFEEPLILDLCAGSGAISIALAENLDPCKIIAVDISGEALAVAEMNIKLQKLNGKILLQTSDLFDALKDSSKKFSCIVTNPPYVSAGDYEKVDDWVKAEPPIAFLAGEKGLDCIDKILKSALKYIVSDGFLAMEIGYDQAEMVKRGFAENGFTGVKSYKDFNGFERVVAGWNNG